MKANKTMKAAIKLGEELKSLNKRKKCVACNGTGHYDHNGSPKCGGCNGTGYEK